jgi:hypothetical protein
MVTHPEGVSNAGFREEPFTRCAHESASGGFPSQFLLDGLHIRTITAKKVTQGRGSSAKSLARPGLERVLGVVDASAVDTGIVAKLDGSRTP